MGQTVLGSQVLMPKFSPPQACITPTGLPSSNFRHQVQGTWGSRLHKSSLMSVAAMVTTEKFRSYIAEMEVWLSNVLESERC